MLSKITVGSRELISHEYNTEDRSYTLAKSTYGNGNSVAYAYDDLDRVISTTYDGSETPDIEYQYDNNGNLGVLRDHLGNRTVKYLYDATDRLMKTESDNLTTSVKYDDLNNLTKQKYVVNEDYFTYNVRGKVELETGYTYDKDNRQTKITSEITAADTNYNAGTASVEYSYDKLGRNNSTVYKHGDDALLTQTIGYVNPTNTITTSVTSTLRNQTSLYDTTYSYAYDTKGNITSISDGTNTITYQYDGLNQLICEDNPAVDKKWTYTYDAGGNITAKKEYDYKTGKITTISYGYSNSQWGDLLTSWNGNTITSDAIGNMLSDGTWSYTWQHGRQLAGMTKSGTTISYTYNSDGMRTSKTVNGTTTKYLYNGSQLIAMDTEFGPMYFHYDASGVMAMEVQGTMLYYVKNAQGDVTALVDTNGYPVVQYTYDAWGNITSTTGLYATTYGEYNPFRYRGYVYDSETGLYYLESRYYNPAMGRFINSDNIVIIGNDLTGTNLFAYCGNNPVNKIDPSGHFSFSAIFASLLIAIKIVKIVYTVKEIKRVQKELSSMPRPTKDITNSFRETLKNNADTIKNITNNQGLITASIEFVNKVRPNGDWDLKLKPEYQGTFKFNGMVIEGQDIGNIHYGYIGKALGLPDSVLLSGAGLVQIMSGTTTVPSIIVSNGDDLRDQMFIRYGIMLYNEDNS